MNSSEKNQKEKESFQLPSNLRPFLGRILVEVLEESTREHLKKLYGATLIEIPDTSCEGRVPLQRGTYVLKAKDSFGEHFKKRYGSDFEEPKPGDILWWIPNQSYKVDIYNKYHAINDEDIVLIEYLNRE